MPDNPLLIPGLDNLIKSATHLRFPAGVFGKTCMLVAVVATAFAAIAWSVSTDWVSALALVLLSLLTCTALFRLFNFADRNPAAAILEGAEFIKHEEMTLQYKGQQLGQNVDIIPIADPTAPLLEKEQEETQALLPDKSDEGGAQ